MGNFSYLGVFYIKCCRPAERVSVNEGNGEIVFLFLLYIKYLQLEY